MKVAISQPTYLPWLGYFDLIDQVDAFVLLDTVQFEKQSWQQRNRIKTPLGLQWLTVPVVFRGRFGQEIQHVEIREPQFWRKHLRALELNYRRSPFFDRYFPDLSLLLASFMESPLLVDLNIRLIEWLSEALGIHGRLLRSSHLAQPGKRSELLANICGSLGADTYLSPFGGAEYILNEMQFFAAKHIDICFQNYQHPAYRQQFGAFCPYASVIDLLFNEGERSLEMLRSGRRTPFLPDEIGIDIQNEAIAG